MWKHVISEDAILRLIEKGRHRGFITESEILNAFPNIEKDIEGLERLYERLDGANINIICRRVARGTLCLKQNKWQ